MGLLDRPRAAALAARAGWVYGGGPDQDGVFPTHAGPRTMDNRQMMELHRRSLTDGPLGGTFGGGLQTMYRTGTSRLRNLVNSYGGTQDSVVWVFACTTLIASTLGSYPWHLEDDDEETVEDAPPDLVQLLRRPTTNPTTTWFDLLEALGTDLELVGNGYALLDQRRPLDGKPLSIHRLRPDRVRIATNPDGTIRGYVYMPQEGWAIPYEADEVIHFKYPNPLDDYYGMGTVEAIASVLDQISAESGHITGFFQNGARISGVLSIPQTLTDTQFERLKQSYYENYAGAPNAYKMLLAEGGADFKPVTAPPVATGVVDLMKVGKDEALSAFGIPAPLLGGILENANYKMDESQHIFTRAMIPRCRRIAERLTFELIYPIWGLNLKIDAHANEPLDVRLEHGAKTIDAGGSIREAREAAGLPPTDHADADKILVPNNKIPLELAGAPPRPGGSIPMDNNQEAGAPPGATMASPAGEAGMLPQPGSPPGGEAPREVAPAQAPLSAQLADLPEAIRNPKALEDLVSRRVEEAIARLGAPAAEQAKTLRDLQEHVERLGQEPTAAGREAARRLDAMTAVSSAAEAWGGLGRKRASGTTSAVLPPSEEEPDAYVPPELPKGFEALADTKANRRKDVREWRAHQARTLRVGVDTFEPQMRRFFKAQRDRVLHALSQYGGGQRSVRLRAQTTKAKEDLTAAGIFDLTAENEALVASYLPALDEVGQVAADTPPSVVAGVAWDVSNPAVAGLRDEMAKLVVRINDTTRGKIADVVQVGLQHGYSIPQIANGYAEESYPGVMGVFDEADSARAETIARSESAMTLNRAGSLSYRDAGVELLEVLDGEGDEICAEANGSIWTVDDFESNPIGHPNCSRTAVPAPSGTTAEDAVTPDE